MAQDSWPAQGITHAARRSDRCSSRGAPADRRRSARPRPGCRGRSQRIEPVKTLENLYYRTFMQRPGFDLIAFDGDDTLWHNERSYRHARARFRQLLSSAGMELSDDEIEERVNRTEVENIDFYGYGVSSFTLSLIETAIGLTGGRVTGGDLAELI